VFPERKLPSSSGALVDAGARDAFAARIRTE
jgi:hypothetical protein